MGSPRRKSTRSGFHDVYTQPETVEAYKKTGKFPDGSVLVKEIRKIKTAPMTIGQASWAGEPAVWFVMIKDGKGRFPQNPVWGERWGWTLFDAKEPAKNIATDFKKDCFG